MALYWVWGTGSWSDATNHWATTSGGLPWAGNLPTATDDVFFDSASHTTSYTVTIDATTKLCRDITFAAPASGNVTWAWSVAMTISGSITLYSGLIRTYTGTITMNSTSTETITTAWVTLLSNFAFSGSWWSWELQDNVNNQTWNFNITNWTLTTNNNNVIIWSLVVSGTNTKELNLWSSMVSLTDASTALYIVWATTNFTLNEGTSTIKFTNTSNSTCTFAWLWYTFNNVWFDRWASTGSITISWSNTFNDFKDTGTAAHSLLLTTGTTQNVTTFPVSGTAGNLITINSTTTGTHALVKSWGGTISCDYLNIQHSVATPSDTWYAGTNSTDNQSVATAGSGWTFTAPPSGNTWAWFFMCL